SPAQKAPNVSTSRPPRTSSCFRARGSAVAGSRRRSCRPARLPMPRPDGRRLHHFNGGREERRENQECESGVHGSSAGLHEVGLKRRWVVLAAQWGCRALGGQIGGQVLARQHLFEVLAERKRRRRARGGVVKQHAVL